MYGAVGTGNVQPGIVTVSLGTSGTAGTFMEESYLDPSGEIAVINHEEQLELNCHSSDSSLDQHRKTLRRQS